MSAEEGGKSEKTASRCPVPHDQRGMHAFYKRAGVKSDEGGSDSERKATVADVPYGALDPTTSANMMPPPNQLPAPGQRWRLSTDRIESSIPMGDFVPHHQEHVAKSEPSGGEGSPASASACPHATGNSDGNDGSGEKRWTYPSEQMFFNAMKRKGWKPREEEMSTVVSIHNAVNERTWIEVMRWEKLFHGDECDNPKLLKFMGRPKDPSPKSRVKVLMGYKKPFDRHDWIVDRCGTHLRYIIDYYEGSSRQSGGRQGFHIDARPALDSFGSAVDRVRMWWHDM